MIVRYSAIRSRSCRWYRRKTRPVKTDGVVVGCRCHVGVISIGGQVGHHCATVWAGGSVSVIAIP